MQATPEALAGNASRPNLGRFSGVAHSVKTYHFYL